MNQVAATVVDTDVFSLMYLRRANNDSRVAGWREYLTGRRVLISFQTRAEVLVGARSAQWGGRRMAETIEILDRTPTIRPDNEVVDAYAELAAECRRIGHGLQAREHTGDRWVAACAIAKRLDLLAGDAIYQGAPNLVVHS
ncbi:PIN domain-containing protein [Mycobacterium kansasii]|uniref:Twitching motility protein PilT n=2 Tax=Mycobacterium kansasii TaxID=1768 RepID=U5WTW6_MYCKA|nr:PIN domain-containing protein [Mycobacterium kansasii]AGZ52653.1 twitching motility protein PilT [Mycobacterium kansasii ATCC 12478]EUA21591.1 PIN domain protein [Mycobacterium kansasii 662]MXO39242.1 type II toxin-antitoxin system VapC family toxin [Mycobacterium kansasii]POX73794.1 PIN domain-containing protein [Mycobacterium kansasii]POX81936.1 PIN domain-containing protein [Mycobacterium kansasii]